jgi:hypothetical protein
MNNGHLEGDRLAAPKRKPPAKVKRKRPTALSGLRFSCLWLLGMAPFPVSAPEPKSKNRRS